MLGNMVMGFHLIDPDDRSNILFINFWNWRTIVEAARRLEVVDDATAERMHLQCTSFQLSPAQALDLAMAIEDYLLPSLEEDDRVLLDGTITDEADDGTFHKVDVEKNYSTNAKVLRAVMEFCRSTQGVVIN